MSTTYRTGHFVWRELMTPDPKAALRFYTELFGWSTKQSAPTEGHGEYVEIVANGKHVGGVMKTPAGSPMPPMWSGYVSVTDVDGAAKTAGAAGGQVVVGPMDIPRVGRFAGVVDPTGAYVNVFRAKDGDGETSERPGVGEFCWETLSTSDASKAKDFYTKLCGWKVGSFQGMDTFQVGESGIADIQAPPPNVPSHWLSFVVVPDRAAAVDRAKRLGGNVMVERVDIPEVGQIAIVSDPTGAAIGIFEAPASQGR